MGNYAAPLASSTAYPRPLLLARWLWICALWVVMILVVGGITRLTESGLSITSWELLSGAIPPLNEAEWQAQFAAYQHTGEYQKINGPAGMMLGDYQRIYFWEWLHRLLGRLMGLIYALPLWWFWIKKQVPTAFKSRLLFLLFLGGAQGAFGWFMVRSGLSVNVTDVSHFWLSIHLMTALLTLAILVWTALDMQGFTPRSAHFEERGEERAESGATEGGAAEGGAAENGTVKNGAAEKTHAEIDAPASLPKMTPTKLSGGSLTVIAILFVQFLLGAWVAGLDAGLASNSWPLMQGQFLPEFDARRGLFWALTHDPFLLHFMHRWWAWITALALLLLMLRISAQSRGAAWAIMTLLAAQIALGIVIVLQSMPLMLAAAHQICGALLLIAVMWGAHIFDATAQNAQIEGDADAK